MQDESLDLTARFGFLEELKHRNDTDALVALAHSCFARNLKIVQCAQDIIKGLPTDRFQILLNYLFTDGFGKSGEKFLQLVDELRGSDVMRHLLRLLGSQSDTGEQYYQLARWLRNTGILDKYLRLLLTFPPAVAENAFMLLTRLDYRVPTYLARLTDSLPPQMCLEVLKLLGQLEWQSETPLLRTIRKLIQHENPAIRARTADFVGRTSQNVWFLQRLAQDPVPEVRLSTLRAIMKSSVIPPKIITLLRKTTLSDSDVRVRVKAAQLLYHQGDIEGLRALIVMLDQPTSLERAYAARILGELKEISVRDNLKALVQGDADSTVRSEALKALKALDEQVEFLIQQFKQLEGILTRYRLSGDEQTKRFLWDYLEALDRHPVTGMIQSTDLAPETFRQFMAVVNEVGMHIAIPFLFATIIDEDRRIGNEKTADLYRMRAETTQIVRELQSGEPETIARTFDKLTRIQQDMVKVMLVAALNVENPTTTVAAAKTLHELAYALGSDKLSVLINGSDYAKRVEAVKALSIISDEFAARQLLQLEDEPDGEIRDLVHTGLAAIHSKLERYDVGEVQLMIKEVDPTESPMVKLHALITDAENRRLGDVELNDLVVLEGNDKPLKARHISSRSHTPVAVAMIMDYSGSMTKAAIRDVEMATKHFIDKLHSTDSAAILKFATEVDVAQELTGDHERLVHAIQDEYQLDTQGTALYDSILRAIDQLDAAEESTKIVVVNTDGEDNASYREAGDVIDYAIDRNTEVYAVGLGDAVDTETLEEISYSTYGRYYATKTSSQLQNIYEEICDNIRIEYDIT